jgi:hypothetical protein
MSLKKEYFPFTYKVTKYALQQPFLKLQKGDKTPQSKNC